MSVIWKRSLADLLPPVVLALIVAAAWQLAVVGFQIPPVLLPGPVRVVVAAWNEFSTLSSATFVTAQAALLGLTLSILGGVVIATMFSQSKIVRRSCYPYAIFLQTVPIVAIAPLIVIWMGEGFAAVTTIAFIISLFPIITNVTDGMTSVSSGLRDLFRLNRATRLQTLWHLQLPNALPNLVTGAKISSGTAVLGAIVGEFFAGAGANRPGLGYLIFAAKGQFRLDFLFAAVIACTTLGVLIFFSVGFAGDRCLLFWQDAKDDSVR